MQPNTSYKIIFVLVVIVVGLVVWVKQLSTQADTYRDDIHNLAMDNIELREEKSVLQKSYNNISALEYETNQNNQILIDVGTKIELMYKQTMGIAADYDRMLKTYCTVSDSDNFLRNYNDVATRMDVVRNQYKKLAKDVSNVTAGNTTL